MMNSLEKELEYLTETLIRMGNNVIANLKIAFDCYLNYDEKKVYEINDDLIDQQERLLEEECLDILIKERAYASDLRMVTGILKLISDLERLGDHAEDILEFALRLKDAEKHHLDKIDYMANVSLEMVNNAITSFVKRDKNLANKVIDTDALVDKKYYELIDLIIELLKEEKISSPFATYTILVVKYIERVADHAVNIAEWVVYILSGFHKDRKIF